MFKMLNPIQAYDWGSYSFIQDLLSIPSKKDQPYAELWMGAHPKSPSRLVSEGCEIGLDIAIEADKEHMIGKNLTGLPYLFKILAAERPLSIQAHPNKKQAETGYRKENELGIPFDAPNRNYKDNNHKPELMCALTTFSSMCGFRSLSSICTLAREFGMFSITGNPKSEISTHISNNTSKHSQKATIPVKKVANSPTFGTLLSFLFNEIYPTDQLKLKTLFSSLLRLDDEQKQFLLADYLSSIQLHEPQSEETEQIKFWTLKLADLYPNDIGIVSPLLLNIIRLKPYQAIYLEAGVLHAYLQGAGVEIMANSDNVLRGGLTSKYIDPEELISVLKFEPFLPEIIKPLHISKQEAVYQTPAKEFILSRVDICTNHSYYTKSINSAEIILCIEGNATCSNATTSISIRSGESVFIPAGQTSYTISGNACLFIARNS